MCRTLFLTSRADIDSQELVRACQSCQSVLPAARVFRTIGWTHALAARCCRCKVTPGTALLAKRNCGDGIFRSSALGLTAAAMLC